MQNQTNLQIPASKEELLQAIEVAEALIQKHKYNKVQTYFTDEGPNSRDHYPKQMELMRAGKKHRLRAFIGGNGSGKSLWLALESYFHLSGKYPTWWEGHKFIGPINAWLCGREAKNLREGLQEILFGGIGKEDIGTGIIAKEDILDDGGDPQTWAMTGTPNCVGQFKIRHYTNGIFDGWSKCEFKTYAQGWAEFQGPTRQWIGFDEEPDDGKIFAECIARLRGKDGNPPGHFLAAFTPTDGFRDVYLSFVPNGIYPENGLHPEDPSKFTQRVGWSNSPHLDEEWKQSAIAQWKLTDPNNIQARTEGYAAIGSGRVYPIPDENIVVNFLKIAPHWPRAYGLDFGWNKTAVIWGAKDPETGVLYLYSEYYFGQSAPYVHAHAIKQRGFWIPGICDPRGDKSSERDGSKLIDEYRSLGLELVPGDNSIKSGIARVLGLMDAGLLKVTYNLENWLKEFRVYRYDSKNPNDIARNQADHLMDATRYLVSMFDSVAISAQEGLQNLDPPQDSSRYNENRNNITGY